VLNFNEFCVALLQHGYHANSKLAMQLFAFYKSGFTKLRSGGIPSAIFAGPPSAGKTFASAVLAKMVGAEYIKYQMQSESNADNLFSTINVAAAVKGDHEQVERKSLLWRAIEATHNNPAGCFVLVDEVDKVDLDTCFLQFADSGTISFGDKEFKIGQHPIWLCFTTNDRRLLEDALYSRSMKFKMDRPEWKLFSTLAGSSAPELKRMYDRHQKFDARSALNMLDTMKNVSGVEGVWVPEIAELHTPREDGENQNAADVLNAANKVDEFTTKYGPVLEALSKMVGMNPQEIRHEALPKPGVYMINADRGATTARFDLDNQCLNLCSEIRTLDDFIASDYCDDWSGWLTISDQLMSDFECMHHTNDQGQKVANNWLPVEGFDTTVAAMRVRFEQDEGYFIDVIRYQLDGKIVTLGNPYRLRGSFKRYLKENCTLITSKPTNIVVKNNDPF
jgi:hypothetical protein